MTAGRHRCALCLLLLVAAVQLLAAPRASAWETVSPSAHDLLWVERDRALPGGIFAATSGGLFHTSDAGDSWRLLDEHEFVRLAGSEAAPARLFAVAREGTFVFGVHRSDDGGETFDRVSEILGGGFGGGLLDLTVAPGEADTLYASLSTRPLELATSFESDVLRSSDGGTTWTSIRWFAADTADGGKFVAELAVAATDGDRIYAATSDGLDRSDDGGDTWRTVRAGAWSHLAIDPLDADHLLAVAGPLGGVAGGLWQTHDGGDSWAPLILSPIPEPPALTDVRFDPVDRSVLYAAADDGPAGRVLVSLDAGVTWEPIDGPLEPPVGPLVVTPTSPRHLLVVADGGLERSDLALPLCPDRPTALCLDDDRFLAEVVWRDFQGGSGTGFAEVLTADAGTFWFFEPDNVELALKVLDARTVNDHWWVFYGALTNVGFDLRVTDLVAGGSRLYHNPSGQFASHGDTAAFRAGAISSTTGTAPAWFLALPAPGTATAGACTAGTSALCLLERFRVTVDWQDPTGHGGLGQARALTAETGWFWFFDPDNPEIFVKVLDGRSVNGHWWVFHGSLTDVAFDLVVEDTATGDRATYHHSAGTFASRGDTTALP